MIGSTEDLKCINLDCERQGLTLCIDENIGRWEAFNNSNILDRLDKTKTGNASGQRLENKDGVM